MYIVEAENVIFRYRTISDNGYLAVMADELAHKDEYAFIPSDIRRSFYELRTKAEDYVRYSNMFYKDIEITLHQIYEAINLRADLSEGNKKYLMQMEIEFFIKCIHGIQENIDGIVDALSAGSRAAIVMDTVMPRQAVCDLLSLIEPRLKGVPVYVSSQYKNGVQTDNLLETVLQEEGASGKECIYLSSSTERINIACGLRMSTRYYPSEKTDIEKNIAMKFRANRNVELALGTICNARLDRHMTDMAAIGCDLMGMTIIPYVFWLIDESIRQGIERLYFIARDGYMIKKIADLIIRERKLRIETKYIYGSRKVWRLPSLEEEFSVIKFLQVSDMEKILSVTDFANVFQIDVVDFMKFIPGNYQTTEMLLMDYDIMHIAYVLEESAEFKQFVIKNQRSNRENAIQYLQLQIDTHNEKFAFVELSGSGYTQKCLMQLLKAICQSSCKTFYFHMGTMKHCGEFQIFCPARIENGYVIETLCRAPHGQCIGYAVQGNDVIPVLEEYGGGKTWKANLEHYLEGAITCAEYFLQMLHLFPDYINDMNLPIEAITYMIQTPDVHTLEFFACQPFEVSGREEENREMAPRLTHRQIQQIFYSDKEKPVALYYKGACLEYSMLRCTEAEKELIEYYRSKPDGRRWQYKLPEGEEFSIKNRFHLPDNSKVVIYAAGNVGQYYYERLQREKDPQVVLWVDRNWEAAGRKGLEVCDPAEIKEHDFDFILIALLEETNANEVRADLMKMGIPIVKICWIPPRMLI